MLHSFPASPPRLTNSKRPDRYGPLGIVLAVLLLFPGAMLAQSVGINGLTFTPADITIEVGQSVTWSNDGGFHNVIADDGTFTSGAPSTNLWVFTHIFHQGGVFGYSCQVHVGQGMVGSVTVDGIFGDSFDGGDLEAWDSASPTLQRCKCYFSADCNAGQFCDWGDGGPSTEDICGWVDGKPNGVVGAGCNLPHVGPWGGDICDGVCAEFSRGSSLGREDPALLAIAIREWARALLDPAARGGGSPEARALARIEALPLRTPQAAMQLGRQLADLLIHAADRRFYAYFCHHEQHPNEPDPSLYIELDPCRDAVARGAAEALAAEVEERGSGLEVLEGIPGQCPAWSRYAPAACSSGDIASCLGERTSQLAVFLTTPSSL